jgi:hypothetical protein
MMKKRVAAVLAAALIGGISVAAVAQINVNPAMVTSVNFGDLFNDVVGGNSAPVNRYASISQLATYILSSGAHPVGTPALTSCGTTPAIVGTDTVGTLTMGATATGCIVTFAKAYTAAPHCTVSWRATPLASQSYTVSTTALTLTQTSTSNNLADYNCAPQVGG